MNIAEQIIAFFQRPFPPTEDWRHRLILAIGVGLFVTFFLYIFEPFGLSIVRSNKFFICLGFGATTLIASVLFEIVMVKGFGLYDNIQQFTFGKWVIQTIGLILTISIANFLFGRWLHGNMEWRFFPQMLFSTFAIGIFPTVVLGSISMLRQERKYQDIATDINNHPLETTEKSIEEQRSLGEIPVSAIRYLEAFQNYIKIGYVDAGGDLQESMQRATLKALQSELVGTSIVKCHRSYLVNRDSVVSVRGNAQGLLLSLRDIEKEIPVSRSFVPSFR